MILFTTFTCILLSLFQIGCTLNSTGYLLTFPVVLPAGAKEKFCMVLHGSENFKSYTLTLTHQDTEIVEEFNLWTDEGGCKELAIPKKVGKYDIALLETEGRTKLQEMEVDVISGQNLITFVQTDKPIYKPGQKVQFRVLTMKRDLIPRTGKISQVLVKDPNDVRVKQWLEVQSEGLTGLDFQLAEEPLLGEWKIEVLVDGDSMTQTFKVDEYVLPKFEVTINPPKYLLSNASKVEGEICAKYTYGKPVNGRLVAEVCLGGQRSLNSPCASIVEEINGCYSFSVNATDVGFRKGYYFYRSELKISAEVWESETGAMVKEFHKGPTISFDPLKITLKDDTNKFFKPSFPYHGQAVVTKPDGSVAPGELIEITMVNYKHDVRLSRNFTTDKNGIIKFSTCDPLTHKMAEFKVQARAVEYVDDDGAPPSYRLYMPRAYSTIKQWFSPSLSYIQIPKINYTVKCGEEVTLDIPYTTTLDSYTLFHYQVMSRGKMLHTGHKEHHFLKHDKKQMLNVLQEECLIREIENRPPPPPSSSPTPEPTSSTVHIDPTQTTATSSLPTPGTPPPEKLVEQPFQPEFFEPLLEAERFEPLGMLYEPLNSPIRKKRSFMPPYLDQETEIKLSDDPSTHVSHVKIKFVVTPDMAPNSNLLVYYIRDDGETVADSISFNVEKCFRNKVSMKFNHEEVLPGALTVVSVEASPGSLCSIGVVDKSINILGGDHQLTPEKLLEAIEDLDLSQYNHLYNDQTYCENKRKAEKEATEGESMEIEPTFNRWYFYSSKYVDAIQAFKNMNLRVMTNLQVESRPCSYSHPVVYDSDGSMEGVPMVAFASGPGPKMAENTVVPGPTASKPLNLRTHFPETWLWQLSTVGEDGKLQMMTAAPHTITKWQGNTLCSSPDVGFGFSPVASLTTFQPFFLSFTLPYSAIRDERIPIRVTVFNYLEKCLLMQVNLEVWEDIEVVQRPGQNDAFCVCGGKSHTAKYYIVPQDIGELPITAIAEIIPGSCDKSLEMDTKYVGMRDAAERNILVKAEGVQQEYSLSKYICLDSGKDAVMEKFDLQVPEDHVFDSARGEFTVIGDIMGPALSNLDNLVSQPTGCGEQTMVTFTPNIYVLKYLQSVQQDTEEMEALAKSYMEIGYQRELTFRHDDGSFSAFGKSDKSGSTWLTAFVIQSFAQAQEFIYIDTKDLEKSIKFIRTRARLENGCFREVGKVFSSYMMGGLDTTKDPSIPDYTTLTAYVLISLLEANVSKQDSMITEGMNCLNAQEPTEDVYTIAVLAYANVLFDVNSTESIRALDRLNERVIKNGNIEHWARKGAKPKPVNSWYHFAAPTAEVEMTAYGMLARLHSTDNIGDVVPLAMWMSQQRNSFGGYASTQDTVVGLHALSEFAAMLKRDSDSDGDTTEGLKILFQGHALESDLNVTSHNALLLQTVNLKELPNFVEVTAKGQGCALIQANVRYNKYPADLGIEENIFSLKVSARREENDCALKAMEICVSFSNHDGYSDGMSLVTVSMVTGWSVEPKSLKKLRSRFSLLNMKKYEIDNSDGSINFYFDELDHRQRCFKFDVIQNKDLAVSSPKPGIVKVFQYYEKEVSAIRSYTLKTICGTKEEIPIKPQPPIDETMILQRRVFDTEVTGGGETPLMKERINDLTSARDVPAPPKRVKCPVCLNGPPENLDQIVCQSGSILKVSAGRTGRVTMKLKADLRPRRKQRLDEFVSVDFNEQCTCDLIKPPKRQKRVKRLLVFTESPNLFEKEGQKEKAFNLTKAKYVINLDLDKKLERRVRILSKKCRTP